MSTFYGKLKALEYSSERKPVIALTKSKWSDTLFIIRGKDEGIPCWHYILVPYNKILELKNCKSGETIDCNRFGSIIQYCDNNGQICSSSGWGINPSYSFQTWIENQYGDRSFDENIKFEYLKDDIRLCTMQRLIPSQLIGICRYYNKQGHFHYIKLFENYQTTLAYRSGIQNYDRFISFNGINIENYTLDQLTIYFQNQLNFPVQMLVCSPATYQFYKSNNIIIHQDLPTVQYLKPVFDISLSNQNLSSSINSKIIQIYYVIQWENNNIICVVHQSSIFKSTDFIEINDICFIETEGKYRRGIIQFKGSKEECLNIENKLITQLNNGIIEKYNFHLKFNDHKSVSQINTNSKTSSDKILSSKKSVIEDLPNELLFDFLNYLTLEQIHDSFFNLNNRLNKVLLSRYNVSFIYDENVNTLIMKYYRYSIEHLTIDSSKPCDLTLFVNLRSLIIRHRNLNVIKEILPEINCNLIYLSFILKSDFEAPNELVDKIFSNKFLSLRYVNLGWIEKCSCKNWSICPSVERVSIRCDKLLIVEQILKSCPNLKSFEIHILNSFKICNKSSPLFSSSLERFLLWSEEFELKCDIIESIVSLMPNITRLYLQTKCRTSFIRLIENLIQRLNNLNNFDCFIKELLNKNERIGNINDIHQVNLCFKRIQCIKETEYFRIFSTD